MMHFGTDPEFFILDEGGKSVPAHTYLPPKSAPIGVASEGVKRGLFQFFRDGYAVEVNVAPATQVATLSWRVQAACEALRTFILGEGERLSTRPGVPVEWDRMDGAPTDVMEVGCDPSLDAYTGLQKFPSLDPKTIPDRFAGGHMHFSTTKLGEKAFSAWADKDAVPGRVKILDLYVGLPLTYLFPSEEGFHRRLFYGQAGEYRYQDYGTHVGFEYRVPSPQLWGHPAVASLAFLAARRVIENPPKWDPGIENDLRGAINGGIGMEKLLPTLPGFYDPPLLKRAAETLRPLVESPGELDPTGRGWHELVDDLSSSLSHVMAA